MEQPVLIVGPGTTVVVKDDVRPGEVFLVDAVDYWTNDLNGGEGWKRPLLKGVDC